MAMHEDIAQILVLLDGQSLGQHVCNLVFRVDLEEANGASEDFLIDEVNLHHQVSGIVRNLTQLSDELCGGGVCKERSRAKRREAKFREEATKPNALLDGFVDPFDLSLCARVGHSCVLLGSAGNCAGFQVQKEGIGELGFRVVLGEITRVDITEEVN